MASDVPLAPDFINFLFSKKPKFDAYFVVGNKSQEEPERIGAVKLMLMAHSEVFQLQLEESELKEKGDIPVEDVHPSTFKLMLKYVYGYDTTSDLCFDDADNMLYVAEKYMMKTLKNKLAGRLMKLLNPDNLCSLLNNLACYTHLELDSAITEILRYETDHVLASPQFLGVNTEGFLKILEQDGLAVPEIELWRAAIKWAKHRANTENGKLLRQQISGLTQHLRLLTFTQDEIFEIIPSKVLTTDELASVCLYREGDESPQDLNEISSENKKRKILQKKKPVPVQDLEIKVEYSDVQSSREYCFTLLTKNKGIEMLPFVFKSKSSAAMAPEKWTYKVVCTITITEVANPFNADSSSTSEPPINVTFSQNVKYGVEFEIPLAVDGKNVILTPDSKYTMLVKVNGMHERVYNKNCGTFRNDSLVLNTSGISTTTLYETYVCYNFPFKKLQFRVQ